MANRINIYTLFRKIHLYSALGLMVFLLMYFVTGWMMTHNDLFTKVNPPVTETSHRFHPEERMEEQDLARHIQDEFGLNGKIGNVRSRGDSLLIFTYNRPGMTYEAKYFPVREELVIKKEPHHGFRTMVVFHRIHGYGGGFLYSLFVFLMDLTSIACILFAVTGIYLWFRLLKIKWLGLIILLASLVYILAVIGQLMA